MSTNLHFRASREIQVIKTGKIDKQVIYLSIWQTPSDVTRKLLKTEDPIQSYCDWVLSISKDEEEPVYADDDLVEEKEPVGHKTVNSGKDHIQSFLEECEKLKENGYEIETEGW